MEHDDREEELEEELPETPAAKASPEYQERIRAAYTEDRRISRDEYLDY